jgi:NADP-dependent 3-hydroxy acid dehydrogenase YdfG
LHDATKAILPHFKQNRDGVLINISSVGGKVTFPYGALYHGTKFAVEGITESLAFEMELIDCRAKMVEPGTIRYTAGYDAQAFLDAKASQSDEYYIKLVKQIFGL